MIDLDLEASQSRSTPAQGGGPSGLNHIRYLYLQGTNYVEAFLQLQREFGDVVRIRLPRRTLCLFHPQHVQHVLRTHVHEYPKSSDYETLRPLLGAGIFVSEGEAWARQRRLIAPEFRAQGIARFVPAIVRSVESLWERWDAAAASGAVLDLGAEMMHFTLLVVGSTLFRRDLGAATAMIGEDLLTCLDHATQQMLWMGLYKPWLPLPGNLRARRAEVRLDATLRTILRSSREREPGDENAEAPPDVLSRMMRAYDDQGRPMTDQQLLDETKSLVLAGHETTSLALTWAFYLLSRHPEAEAELAAEARRVLGAAAPEFAHVADLTYARMVLLETLRLYPPVPSLTRTARRQEDFGGLCSQPDELIQISPYVTHRHPDFWARPDAFEPQRFEPARADSIDPYSYIPFLIGRRACIGEHFAMLEGTLALAMIARRYRIAPVSRAAIGTRPLTTLRLARPFLVRVSRI